MKKTNCRICQQQLDNIMSFGNMPIANGFLSAEEFEHEYLFELAIGFCPDCYMVQLLEQPQREAMFHENYAFYSSTSVRMRDHFQDYADWVIQTYLPEKNPFVVEIGSNDGIMLQFFAALGIAHLGVEPSANVAAAAMNKDIRTEVAFFDEALAEQILSGNGYADAILAANVMCHIPNLHSVVSGAKKLLKPDGVLVFEDPYLLAILDKTSYDQIYDEHVFYFSITSLSGLFAQHDMEIIDTLPQEVHGGSMRYVIANKGQRPLSPRVLSQRRQEDTRRLFSPEIYGRFRDNVERSRGELMTLLSGTRKSGGRIVGYAATSKSATVINYCGITPDLVEYISDTTPIKQGKYSPGMHIPVRSYEEFKRSYPDYALLFGWNHAEEIMAKEKEFIQAGGRWILYVPQVKIL